MTVDWQEKWLRIPYGDQFVVLQGDNSDPPEQVLVQLCLTTTIDSQDDSVLSSPVEIQLLINQFAPLFAEPTSLPPSRACDHEIPLIPGARPVNIRPYRYPPALRDEIEKQVAEMLDEGLIQPSASLFSCDISEF